MNRRYLEVIVLATVAFVLVALYDLASRQVLADHVVANLLSPGGLTTARVAVAVAWIALRLLSVFGVPAVVAFGITRFILWKLSPGAASEGGAAPPAAA